MDLDRIFGLKEEDNFQPREREEEMKIPIKQNADHERLLLLKKKMFKSDELIGKYNAIFMECDLLRNELSTVKAEKQNILNKYNLTMEKVTRLELAITDCKQSADKYRKSSETQKLELCEKEVLLSQYNFKIKSLDKEKSELEDTMKKLQENFKSTKGKDSEKKQMKHKSCQTLRIEKRDFSQNTDFGSLCEFEKPQVENKDIMTDEILKTEPFPIFCTKCEILIKPPPINQILTIMSSSPPLLSEKISPPNSPEPKRKMIKLQEPFETDLDMHNEDSIAQTHFYDHEPKQVNKPKIHIPQKIDDSSIIELAKRIDKIESLMNIKKRKTKRNSHINKQYCTSKNINLVVKVPHQIGVHEYRKRENSRIKKIKRLKNKPFKIDNHRYLDDNKWIVEHCTGPENEKAIIQTKERSFKKQKDLNRRKQIDSLFESPKHLIPQEKTDYTSLSSPEGLSPMNKTSSPLQASLSPSKSLSNRRKISKLDIKKKLLVENVNIEKSVVESDVDISLSCSSLSSQLSVDESINKLMQSSAKDSSYTKKLHISNRSPEVEINKRNRHRLLPNEKEKRRNLLHVEDSIERVNNNNEANCIEQPDVYKFIEEKEDNVMVNQSSCFTNESINSKKRKISKKTLASPIKSEKNNLLESFKHTDNLQRHDETVISSCKKNLYFDASLQQSNNKNSIDSTILEETDAFDTLLECSNKDKQKENVYSKEAEKDLTSNQRVNEPSSIISVSDIKIVEHSSFNMPQIETDNISNIFTKDTSLSNESLTNELVENPENSAFTKDTSSPSVSSTNILVQTSENSIFTEDTSLMIDSAFTKDANSINGNLTNDLAPSPEDSKLAKDANLSNEILTDKLVENLENTVFTKITSLPNASLMNEIVPSSEDSIFTQATSLKSKNLTYKLIENPKNSTLTKDINLPNESLTDVVVPTPENTKYRRRYSLPNKNLINELVPSSENRRYTRAASLLNENLINRRVENSETNTSTKDSNLPNENLTNELVTSGENNTFTNASLSNETLTNVVVESPEKNVFTKGTSLLKECITNESIKNPENSTFKKVTILPNEISTKELVENQDNNTFTNANVLKENLTNEFVENLENVSAKDTNLLDDSLMSESVTSPGSIFSENSSLPNFLNELITSPKKCDETNQVKKCISPQSEINLYQSILIKETDMFSETIKNTVHNPQGNLLSVLTENSDENSSNNVPLTLPETSINSKELEPANNLSLTDTQVIAESEQTDEACTLPIEDTVNHENRSEGDVSNPDENFQNSHILPVLPTISSHREMCTFTTEKSPETASPNPSISNHVSRENSLSPITSAKESKSVEAPEENLDSSLESSDTVFFRQSVNVRRKISRGRRFIFSDESSNDSKIEQPSMSDQIPVNSGRKSADAYKMLMMDMTNLKRVNNDSRSLSNLSPSLPKCLATKDEPMFQFSSLEPDSSLIMSTKKSSILDAEYVPSKKRRIAHKPKNIEPSTSNENKQDSPNKKVVKNRELKKKSEEQSDDKVSEILEVFDKTCKERHQIFQKLKPPKPLDVSLRSMLDNVTTNSILIQNDSESSENTTLIPAPVKKARGRPPKNKSITTTTSKTSNSMEDKLDNIISPKPRGRQPKKTPKKETPKKLSNVSENSEKSADTEVSKPEAILEEGELSDIVPLDISVNNKLVEEENLQASLSTLNDASDTEISNIQVVTQPVEIKKQGKKRKSVPNFNQDDKSPMRELRSRHVPVGQETFQLAPKATCTIIPKTELNDTKYFSKQVDETNSCLCDSTIRSLFNKYLTGSLIFSHRNQRNKIKNQDLKENETTCYKQFDILIKAKEWTTELQSQVIEKLLSSAPELKTLAFFLVEYAAEKFTKDEPLDKCNTPPAPMMPRSEQKLVTLISTITQTHAEFDEMVQRGLAFKLFRLNSVPSHEVQMVERLFRILVVLNKIKKDREKVRMYCCDALYCLGVRSMNTIHVALTCWPEVFPKHDSNNDIIVKTIVHIVMSLQIQGTYPKLNSLRMLLTTFYGYPSIGCMTNDFRVDLMKNLQENTPGINTAVMLLCKKFGPIWAYDNIIRGLKIMIVSQSHACLYEALCLLGNLLRSFPIRDSNKIVGDTIDQLCDVLNDNALEGSGNLQEGIVSCLLSISKFKFEQIAKTVIKWQFDKELRSTTEMKLNWFFNQKSPEWWWRFVQSNFPLPIE